MSLASPVLRRLEQQLPLDCLSWDRHAGSHPEAAVLVALTDEREPRVLLGRRAAHLQHHPGEVAFPGGKREPEDASPWVTAQREACEEVGIHAALVHPLGELRPMVTRTGFEVHPCIARIPPATELVIDRQEFDAVFYQPLLRFADPSLMDLRTYSVDGRVVRVPHYRIDGEDIWGVTAAVLALVVNTAYDAGLDLQRDWGKRA